MITGEHLGYKTRAVPSKVSTHKGKPVT
jgi:hypothetical protein